MLTFDYQGYPSDDPDSVILRPTIRVWLRGPGLVPEQVGLIDTGADDVLVPHYLGVRLGLDFRATDRILYRGVGGSVLAYPGRINLLITDGQTTYIWSALVYFHEANDYRILLGHSGFLEHF